MEKIVEEKKTKTYEEPEWSKNKKGTPPPQAPPEKKKINWLGVLGAGAAGLATGVIAAKAGNEYMDPDAFVQGMSAMDKGYEQAEDRRDTRRRAAKAEKKSDWQFQKSKELFKMEKEKMGYEIEKVMKNLRTPRNKPASTLERSALKWMGQEEYFDEATQTFTTRDIPDLSDDERAAALQNQSNYFSKRARGQSAKPPKLVSSDPEKQSVFMKGLQAYFTSQKALFPQKDFDAIHSEYYELWNQQHPEDQRGPRANITNKHVGVSGIAGPTPTPPAGYNQAPFPQMGPPQNMEQVKASGPPPQDKPVLGAAPTTAPKAGKIIFDKNPQTGEAHPTARLAFQSMLEGFVATGNMEKLEDVIINSKNPQYVEMARKALKLAKKNKIAAELNKGDAVEAETDIPTTAVPKKETRPLVPPLKSKEPISKKDTERMAPSMYGGVKGKPGKKAELPKISLPKAKKPVSKKDLKKAAPSMIPGLPRKATSENVPGKQKFQKTIKDIKRKLLPISKRDELQKLIEKHPDAASNFIKLWESGKVEGKDAAEDFYNILKQAEASKGK